MRDLKGENNGNTSSVPSSQFLILSLFILLLAFFIALTSGADFDENKTDPVIDSLEKVFPVNRLRGNGVPAFVQQTSDVRGEGDAQVDFDTADAIFSSDSFPFQKRTRRADGAFIVTMTQGELSELLSISAARVTTPMQRQRFFATLSTFLSRKSGRTGHNLNVILSTSEHPSRLAVTKPDELTKLIRRSEDFALGFQKNGISRDNIISGLQKGQNNDVNLIFTPISAGGN